MQNRTAPSWRIRPKEGGREPVQLRAAPAPARVRGRGQEKWVLV